MGKPYKYSTAALDRTVFVFDRDFNVLEIQNPGCVDFEILRTDYPLGKNIADVFDHYSKELAECKDVILEKLTFTRDTGKTSFFEFSIDREGRKFYLHGYVVTDDCNIIFCSLVFLEEKELLQPRERYFFDRLNITLDHIHAGVFVVHGDVNNRDNVSIYSNNQYKEMFDCPSGDPRDSTTWDHPTCYDYDTMLLKNRIRSIGYEMIVKDDEHNTDQVYDVHKKLYFSEDETFTIVTTVTDITDLRHQVIATRQAQMKAEAADRMKSAFMKNITHEIRTPLNSIQGFTELLCETQMSDQERHELFNYVKDSTDSLVNLLDNLLDLSQIDTGIINIEKEWFDVSETFNEIHYALNLKKVNVADKVEFRTNVPEELRDYMVNTSRKRVIQIVRHFTTNALKYTYEGYVEMGYDLRDNGIYVYVKDTGVGIPEAKRNLVFEKFEKLDSLKQGTGIGLAICKAIVDAMGGDIGCKPNGEKGTIFYAWFPCVVRFRTPAGPRISCSEET